MFNFINIYSFISVSVCVGKGPSALLCPGAYYAVKTSCLYILLVQMFSPILNYENNYICTCS